MFLERNEGENQAAALNAIDQSVNENDLIYERETKGNFKQMLNDNAFAQNLMVDDMINDMAGKETAQ